VERRALWGLLLLAVLPAACHSDPTGPVPDELVGRWEADPFCLPACWFTIQSVADPARTVNLTDNTSANLRLDVERGGTFRFRLGAAGVDAFDRSGDLTVEPGMLVLRTTEGVDTLDYALESGFLRVDFRERLAFDFDGDGAAEDATASARLQHIE
jgi:hypothetical protein